MVAHTFGFVASISLNCRGPKGPRHLAEPLLHCVPAAYNPNAMDKRTRLTAMVKAAG
jgi:hypothetical protein